MYFSDDDLHPTFDLNTAYLKSEQDAFKVLLREHVDTWRVLHPHVTDQYTVFSERMKYRETNKVCRSFKMCQTSSISGIAHRLRSGVSLFDGQGGLL